MRKFGVLIFIMTLFVGLGKIYSEPIPTSEFDPETDIKTEMFVDKANLKEGDSFKIVVTFAIPEGYHISDNEYFYMDTKSASGYNFGTPVLSPKDEHKGHPVYKKSAYIMAEGIYKAALTPEKSTIYFGHQSCTEFGDESCFMPVDLEKAIDFSKVNEAVFNNLKVAKKEQVSHEEETSEDDEDKDSEERIADQIKTAGTWSLMIFLFAFLGGILDSMTPCVYPIIPVVISYMGAKSEGKKSAGFILSLFFVLGLAIACLAFSTPSLSWI